MTANVAPSYAAQDWKKITGFGKKKSGNDKVLAGLGGCAVGGALGYVASRAVKKKLGRWLRKKGLAKNGEKAAGYILPGIGCIIGGAVAIKVMKNMDEESKRKQDEAWQKAQAQTGPVDWQSPTHSGTSEVVEIQEVPDGRTCGTRKEYVLASNGDDATAYNRVCRDENGSFVQADA